MSESTEPITWASIKEMYEKLRDVPYAPDMYIVRPEQYEQADVRRGPCGSVSAHSGWNYVRLHQTEILALLALVASGRS